MFLTYPHLCNDVVEVEVGRNPLKSGQCFLRNYLEIDAVLTEDISCRNPLKSGQCFLPLD